MLSRCATRVTHLVLRRAASCSRLVRPPTAHLRELEEKLVLVVEGVPRLHADDFDIVAAVLWRRVRTCLRAHREPDKLIVRPATAARDPNIRRHYALLAQVGWGL